MTMPSKKLSKKSKIWLIGTGTVIFTGVIVAQINGWLSGNKKKQPIINAEQLIQNDTGGRNAQVKQENKNIGDVKNDFGDKTVNNYYPQTKIKTTKKTEQQKDTVKKIEVKGFYNEGGTGNTYNQTYNEDGEQRHPIQSDIDTIKKYVPISWGISMTPIMGDKESKIYADELAAVLASIGYTILPYGWWQTTVGKGRFMLRHDSTSKKYYIWIRPNY